MRGRVDWKRLDRWLAEEPMVRLAEVAAAGAGLILVGGAIRDALTGHSPHDIDLVVEDDLKGTLDSIERVRGRRPARIGDEVQKTHRFRWRGQEIDVASTLGTLEQDLGRRDYTVNAMALRLPVTSAARDVLIDPHGGLADLAARRLRVVDPVNIAADPLRVLRGVRYIVGPDALALDSGTGAVLQSNAPALAGVAGERISAEWQRLLAADGWLEGVELALDLGVAVPPLDGLRSLRATRAWKDHEAESDAETGAGPAGGATPGRLAALLFDRGVSSAAEVEAQLLQARWPRRLARPASRAAAWAGLGDAAPSEMAPLALADPPAASLAGELARVIGAGAPSAMVEMAARAAEPRWVDGALLLQLGMSSGPALGAVLKHAAEGQVLRRWASPEEARDWAVQQAGQAS